MKKILIIILLFASVYIGVNIDTFNVYASDVTYEETKEEIEDNQIEENKGTTTYGFLVEGLLSIDEDIREKEVNENYINNYFNSSAVASSESLDLFRPSTIVIMVINMITILLENIGLAITTIVMLLYNIVSSSFLTTLLDNIFNTVNTAIFDWSNPDSYIYKLIILSSLFSLIYKLLINFKKALDIKNIFSMIFVTILSGVMICFIGQYGRDIIHYAENLATETIVTSFDFEEDNDIAQLPLEVQHKRYIFDLLQYQPFVLRHFGTINLEEIDSDVERAQKRIDLLLSEPTEDNAEREAGELNNNFISDDIPTTIGVSFTSLLLLIHRILLATVIFVLCLALGVFKLAKEIILFFAVFQLIFCLFKLDTNNLKWFASRISWSMMAIMLEIIFSCSLFFVLKACSLVASVGVLFLLPFDLLLAVMLYFAYTNKDKIIESLASIKGSFAADVILNPTSPLKLIDNSINAINKDKEINSKNSSKGDNTNEINNDDMIDNIAKDTINKTESNKVDKPKNENIYSNEVDELLEENNHNEQNNIEVNDRSNDDVIATDDIDKEEDIAKDSNTIDVINFNKSIYNIEYEQFLNPNINKIEQDIDTNSKDKGVNIDTINTKEINQGTDTLLEEVKVIDKVEQELLNEYLESVNIDTNKK